MAFADPPKPPPTLTQEPILSWREADWPGIPNGITSKQIIFECTTLETFADDVFYDVTFLIGAVTVKTINGAASLKKGDLPAQLEEREFKDFQTDGNPRLGYGNNVSVLYRVLNK